MPRDSLLPRQAPSRIALFLLVGFAAVFFVPFHVPVAPAVSDSYTFGFNNRAALILFVVFAGTFAYWSGGLHLVPADPGEAPVGPAMSRRLLFTTLAVTAVVTVTFWLVYRSVGAINEGSYLVDKLQHLATGERPYRDFEFIYGPLLLYIPLVLHRLFRLSLLDAYFLFWVLSWVGGVYLLWLMLAWASTSSPRKNGIYLLAFLGFIFSTISLGLNYTPLRFVAAPFVAVAVWRVLGTYPSVVPGALLSLAGAAWVMFSSPEQGIALCGGTLLFFLIFLPRSRPQWTLALGTLAAGQALLLLLLYRSGCVHYMRGMAQGGYNLPLLPSISTLISLALLVVAVCILANSLRLHRPGGPLEYLILVSLCALPAAFGRCDAGHMFMNTTGAFIAAWTVLSYHRAAGRWMVWSYVLGALFLPLALYQANNFFMFPVKVALFSPADPHPAVRNLARVALQKALGPQRSQATLAKWRAAYPVAVPSDVPQNRTLMAPLGYPSTLLLKGLPPITNGRYRGLANVMTRYEVDEKVVELQQHPDNLLLFTQGSSCAGNAADAAPAGDAHAQEDKQKRRELFLNLLPFYLPPVRHRDDLLAPVCQYITAHYSPSAYRAPLANGEIWQRIPGR